MEEEADEVVGVVVGELVGCLLEVHSVLAGWHSRSKEPRNKRRRRTGQDRTPEDRIG